MLWEMYPLSLSWGLFAVFLFLLLAYAYRGVSAIENLGLPGPTPLPIVGNILTYRKGQNEAFREWRRKYGRVYRIYEGLAPKIVICDPEMIKQVFVKDFSSFPTRKPIPIPIGFPAIGLIFASPPEHKRRRAILSPAFTAAKVKLMIPLMNRCVDHLMQNLERLCVEKAAFDAKIVFGYLSLDVIARTAFGVEVDSQKNQESPFVQNARKVDVMAISGLSLRLITAGVLSMLLPKDLLEKWGLTVCPNDAVSFFHSVLETTLDMRTKQSPEERRVDLLELMRAAREEKSSDLAIDGVPGKSLSIGEITTDAISLFIAGYDTIAGLLGAIAVNLARYPQVQDSVVQEVASVTGKRDDIHHEDIQRLEYLEMVMMETLRMDSTARFPRLCAQTTTLKGLTIPAGMEVIIDSDSLQMDPDFWQDPETFTPERFNKEECKKRDPSVFLAFGQGPRMCIGMQLALMTTKIALVRLLQKYRFVTCPETPKDHGRGFLVYNTSWVKLEPLDC